MMTQPGDAVVVLIGHGRPVIARKVEGRGGRAWHLIGEAFVSGMMEWEMMDRDIYSGKKNVDAMAFV
jgi:hypothetical protein